MANVNPPVKAQAFTLSAFLYKTDGTLITNPGTLTLKISKDYGNWGDAAGAGASEEDSTYGQIKIALDTTDMNADVVDVYLKDDTSGCVPFTATIYTCSATRGLAGTALPAAAADAAGGLIISDAGALDADDLKADVTAVYTATITNAAGTDVAADIIALQADVSAMGTLGDVADAVLDEAMSGHTTAGTLGKAVADILTDTGTTLDTKLDTIDNFLDTEIAVIQTAAVLARKILSNKTVETAVAGGVEVVVYDDDGTTPLGTFTWTDATSTRSALT